MKVTTNATSAVTQASVAALASAHRGRIQVQGDDIDGDPSFPWARETPIPKVDARHALGSLKDSCTASQLQLRTEAFGKATRFIDSGPIRADLTPIFRTFQNRNRPKRYRKSRVDIEVIVGIAFL